LKYLYYYIFKKNKNDIVLFLQLVRPLGSAGPGLLWRIYGAIKRTTKQVC